MTSTIKMQARHISKVPGLLLIALIAGAVRSEERSMKINQPQQSVDKQHGSPWSYGDHKRCQELMKRSHGFVPSLLEMIPGTGWNNLRNVDVGIVIEHNYTLCRTISSNRLLIPDSVIAHPVKTSYVDPVATLFDHWLHATSATSYSINAWPRMTYYASVISGTFSDEMKRLKSRQINYNTVTTRAYLRFYRYDVSLRGDSVILSPQFRDQLLRIGAYVKINKMEEARYEGLMLVKTCGTHVVSRIRAGASIWKDDYLDRTFVFSDDSSDFLNSIKAMGVATLNITFGLQSSSGYQINSSVIDDYMKWRIVSLIKYHGGPPFVPDKNTLNRWIAGFDEHLVAIDRDGYPLYFLVTQNDLPELSTEVVATVREIVKDAIELYYNMNTIPGCTKLGAPNFSFSANLDDGNCEVLQINFTFGGVIQECYSNFYHDRNPCAGLRTFNPKIYGAYSCDPNFTDVKLQSGKRNAQKETVTECISIFSCWYWYGKCCKEREYYSDADYRTYWCAATDRDGINQGYLFGGLYTSFTANPVTGTLGCPPTFKPQLMFTDLQVCISDDYEQGGDYAVPFGGFFSCKTGNPYAARKRTTNQNKWPQRCPSGYSQHLATVDMGCSIYYCMRTEALSLKRFPQIKTPPFWKRPISFREYFDDSESRKRAHSQGMSFGATAACSTLACAGIAAVVLVFLRRKRMAR